MAEDPFEGYRHPRRYAKWLERTRAAYTPGSSGGFTTWLKEAVQGLFGQVAAEADRLVARGNQDGSEILEEIKPYTLWRSRHWAITCSYIAIMKVTQDGETRYFNALRISAANHMVAHTRFRVVAGFDFKSAIAELVHGFWPFDEPLLTPFGPNPANWVISEKPPHSLHRWKEAFPLGLWVDTARFNPSADRDFLSDMKFGARTTKDPEGRAALYIVPTESGYSGSRRFPSQYVLVLYLPQISIQREDAAAKIQRWWRKAWARLERKRLYLRLLAEIYAPGGPGALAAASSFAAAASSQ